MYSSPQNADMKKSLLANENEKSSITDLESNLDIYIVPDSSQVDKDALCKLITVTCICFIFFCIEVTDQKIKKFIIQTAGGLISKSLAILSDAAHLLSDLSGFCISIFSIALAKKAATNKMSYGYHRAEVIGALVSILIIWGLTIVLVFEATVRIIEQSIVTEPLIMVITASIGLCFNLVMAKVLYTPPTSNYHSQQQQQAPQSQENTDQIQKNKVTINEDITEDSSALNQNQQNQEYNRNELKQSISDNNQTLRIKNKSLLILDPQQSNKGSIINEKNQQNNKNLTQVTESENVNLKAAMIHVIGDIIQSLGVLIAAFIIYFLSETQEGIVIYNRWQLADPICTYVFSILVLSTTFSVAKECVEVIMEATPDDLDLNEFKEKLTSIPRVKEVHDLHIWQLSVGKPAMSAHIICTENQEQVLKRATILCRQNGIYHSTIQVELADRQGKQDYIKCDHNIHQ